MKDKLGTYFLIAIFLGGIIGVLMFVGNIGTVQRATKGFKANVMGGSKRKITLYDYSGKAINMWSGKIDLSDSEKETDFLIDGRRVIIHGGIAVMEDVE